MYHNTDLIPPVWNQDDASLPSEELTLLIQFWNPSPSLKREMEMRWKPAHVDRTALQLPSKQFASQQRIAAEIVLLIRGSGVTLWTVSIANVQDRSTSTYVRIPNNSFNSASIIPRMASARLTFHLETTILSSMNHPARFASWCANNNLNPTHPKASIQGETYDLSPFGNGDGWRGRWPSMKRRQESWNMGEPEAKTSVISGVMRCEFDPSNETLVKRSKHFGEVGLAQAGRGWSERQEARSLSVGKVRFSSICKRPKGDMGNNATRFLLHIDAYLDSKK